MRFGWRDGERKPENGLEMLRFKALALSEASELRDVLLAAGISLIEQHGESYAEGLIGIVEAFEDSAASTAGGQERGLRAGIRIVTSI